jgi:hypothetical protein
MDNSMMAAPIEDQHWGQLHVHCGSALGLFGMQGARGRASSFNGCRDQELSRHASQRSIS